MSSQAEAQKAKDSQVQNELIDLEKLLVLGREHITELKQLLAPVLRDNEPKDEKEEPVGPSLVPLASVMRDKNHMLNGLIDTIKDISLRLEV